MKRYWATLSETLSVQDPPRVLVVSFEAESKKRAYLKAAEYIDRRFLFPRNVSVRVDE